MSITTVSRVLNGKGKVSEATRQRVKEVLARHHYQPSAIARGMVSKSLRNVAVLLPDLRTPTYAKAAHVVESECAHRGYHVIVCNTGEGAEDALSYLQLMSQRQVDGVMFIGSCYSALRQHAQLEGLLHGTPCVSLNCELGLSGAYSVMVDDRAGMMQAVEHLLHKGHERVAFVTDGQNDSAQRKLEGYHSVLQRWGKQPWVIPAENTLEGGMEAARHFLSQQNGYTALACAEDILAAGVLKELCRSGISVPDAIAITGYNSSVYAKICEPTLTTVDSRWEMLGLMGVQTLTSLMEGHPESCASMTIQPALVVGQSS